MPVTRSKIKKHARGGFPFPLEASKAGAALLRWYDLNKRDLPWRRTRDPYAILVSEIMLQQTQVVAVLPFYHRWLKLFPDWKSLAQARETKVLKAWEGLGYYRRAINLKKTAELVMERHQGCLPAEFDALLALPGIGRYTAGAVASIAFGLPIPVVDGNVARLFARLANFSKPIDIPQTQKLLWEWAEISLHQGRPGDYNQALMELGAVVCTPGVPNCPACPLKRVCCAQNPASLPLKSKRSHSTPRTDAAALIFCKGKVLLRKSTEVEEWSGLWRLPTFKPGRNAIPLDQLSFTITRYKVRLLLYSSVRRVSTSSDEWIPLSRLKSIPMATPHRKLLERNLFRHRNVTFTRTIVAS